MDIYQLFYLFDEFFQNVKSTIKDYLLVFENVVMRLKIDFSQSSKKEGQETKAKLKKKM